MELDPLLEDNRSNWDARVPVHLGPGGYQVERYLDDLAADERTRSVFGSAVAVLERERDPVSIMLFDGPVPWQLRRYDREPPPREHRAQTLEERVLVTLRFPPGEAPASVWLEIRKHAPPGPPASGRWFGLGTAPSDGVLYPTRGLKGVEPVAGEDVRQVQVPSEFFGKPLRARANMPLPSAPK